MREMIEQLKEDLHVTDNWVWLSGELLGQKNGENSLSSFQHKVKSTFELKTSTKQYRTQLDGLRRGDANNNICMLKSLKKANSFQNRA